jgi:hypothetical protein
MVKFNCDKIKNSPINELLCCGADNCVPDNNLDRKACNNGGYNGINMILAYCYKISDINDCDNRNDTKAEKVCNNHSVGDRVWAAYIQNLVYCSTMDLTNHSNENYEISGDLFESDVPLDSGFTEDDRVKALQARFWTLNRRGKNESLDKAAACCSSDGCQLCDKSSSSSNVYCSDLFDENSTCVFKRPDGTEVTRFYYNTLCQMPNEHPLGPGEFVGIVIGVIGLILTAFGSWYAYKAYKNSRIRG